MKAAKTNAARILDRGGYAYALVAYEVDEDDLSAAHVASRAGLDPGRIFKTLVLKGDRTGYFVCVVPGDAELDLKKAARASGNKSCAMIPMKDLQAVTGYVRGGCSPLGMKKAFPVLVHADALEKGEIHVSAGQRGLQLRLAAADLIRAAGATVADLVRGGE